MLQTDVTSDLFFVERIKYKEMKKTWTVQSYLTVGFFRSFLIIL